jgi:hypothetical protein
MSTNPGTSPMSEQSKDGGPAFPAHKTAGTDWVGNDLTSGMSLRDWFAGHALPHALNIIDFIDDTSAKAAAEYSYQLADAMLKQRTST